MSSILIYPFCRKFSEFARCKEALEEFNEVIPIAPKGFGMEGDDVSVCDGGNPLNIKIWSDYAANIIQADAAFFGYADANISAKSYKEKINEAISLKKRVFITKELKDFLGGTFDLQSVELIDYTNYTQENELALNLLTIPAPVIMIAGIGDRCDKFSIQVKLGNYFSEQGYSVLNFGTKDFSKLFGIETLPRFLFEPMDNGMKVRQFNSYIYNRVIEENPEVVIIGVPGGIMQVNPYEFGEFGELAFIISNAIKSDISILSLYNQELNQDFLDHLIKLCRYKLNYQVNYINIANTDLLILPDEKECQYTTVPSVHIMDNIIKTFQYEDAFLFNALDEISMRAACNEILFELEENL
ncbi:TIGR04066 family peptide maturation system protein [Anaerocolumna sp. MB42-C2]|uniref:TIGR04066 family peptide maturation system protein n=1 Tax=Anaerocolumna sp. MB42-C2 TaxID=3070997 RepID=UPI0027E11513|nr:TIGR04066 family peptide maturation system protein [Anaerocolumna sp. MB42-C2]WMJ85631.1 TIGR04066 family peptide maturation system protein [Anaerocolumna sp. MB42-C2]